MSELPATPSFRLDGRRALVTGASAGIGEAAAVALAEAGADVLLAARRIETMQATVRALRDRGLKADAVALDVTDTASVRQVVAARGPFHILVNNAGTIVRQPFLEVTEEAFDRILGLNLRAAFFVAQEAARGMAEAGLDGSIVNIGSVNGHVARETISVYVASKFAVEGMTKAMALELGPRNIRVNSLCPTWIETPLVKALTRNPDFMQFALSRLPIGRLGRVEDLMGAIVFLASPASAMITGASLLVDGGQTVQ